MGPQADHLVPGMRRSAPVARDAANDYRRLLAALARRASRLGSRDPESAAQESLMRLLENAVSRPAMEFYFVEDRQADLEPPVWPLDQLLAWLHAVLLYVVREEQSRAAFRRETTGGDEQIESAVTISH